VLRELVHQVATDDGAAVEGTALVVSERVAVVFAVLVATSRHWLTNYIVASVISGNFSTWRTGMGPQDAVDIFALRELTPVMSESLFSWCRPPAYLIGRDDPEGMQQFGVHLLAQLAIGTPWGPADMCWPGASATIQRFVLQWQALGAA
jgi:hypothetical protein